MNWRWLGRVPYEDALAAQRAHRDALVDGRAAEEVWCLEHPPVITTGRRTVADLDPAGIAAAGFALHASERGGLATCHEPGQLVAYVLIDARPIGVWRTVAAIEGAVIGWLGDHGVQAGLRDGYPGVWVGNEKICAIGLHFRAGRTMHGLALNLTNDLRGFGLVTPCGIVDGGVTSLERVLRAPAPAPAEAAVTIAPRIIAALLDASRGPVNRDAFAGT